MIFMVIGKIAVWLLGLAAAFYVPFLAILFWGRNEEGISSLAAAGVAGFYSAILYVVVSFIYFAFT